jgi:hypothetical protein
MTVYLVISLRKIPYIYMVLADPKLVLSFYEPCIYIVVADPKRNLSLCDDSNWSIPCMHAYIRYVHDTHGRDFTIRCAYTVLADPMYD